MRGAWCMIGPVPRTEFRSRARVESHRNARRMSTIPIRFPVAVIMQRTPLVNRWASERWEPLAVLPQVADALPAGGPVCVRDDTTCAHWRFDGHALELHRSEAEGYHLNLVAPDPKVFVNWRMHDDPADPPVFPGDRHRQLQRGCPHDGRRRARRCRAAACDRARMDDSFRYRALQARAETQGAPERSVRRWCVPRRSRPAWLTMDDCAT